MTDVTQDPATDLGLEERRALPGLWRPVTMALCAIISLAHIYVAFAADVSELTRNTLHFAGFSLLCAILFPTISTAGNSRAMRWVDLGLGLAVAASAVYLGLAENAIYDRGVRLTWLDTTAAIVAILGGIELTRRAQGWVIPIIVIVAISYAAFWGQYVSGVFRFPGLSVETLLFRSIYGDDALFGNIARISSTFVFLFIIFGAFLVRSGAGDFVVQLARAIAGRLVGGPGLVAVIASGLTGTISGSAVANTANTGVITIPLMKRAGFPPKFAAAVEASASTGGQLMPPIMGAGAFIMAGLTQVPYETIITVAALPAALYFLSVAFFVRMEARKQGLQPFDPGDSISLGEAMRRGGASFIIPIGLLIALLVSGFTPTYAAVIGIVAVIASSWLTTTPMGPRAIGEALVIGARNMVAMAVLLCTIGLLVNVIVTAGVGNTFSLMIAEWSGGNLLIAILLIALASLVLGMGLPVTAAYLVLATLSAPALANMIADSALMDAMVAGAMPAAAGVVAMLEVPEAMTAFAGPMSPEAAHAMVGGLSFELRAALRDLVIPADVLTAGLLSAHMIIFWLSQDSNVTPPVCLAAFTAAAIAKSPPMATGIASWKVAKGIYIVPVLFAYTPFLSGDWLIAFEIFIFALIGIYALAAALHGWMEGRLNIALRIIAGVAGVACLWPGSILVHLAGAAVTIALIILTRRPVTAPTPA